MRFRLPWQRRDDPISAEVAAVVALADDPSAPPDRLRVAAEQYCQPPVFLKGFARICVAISAHPNTPPDTLFQLLNQLPEPTATGLFQNPILPLLPLECPDFFSRLQVEVIACLLQRPDLPEIVAQQFISHEDPLLAWEARTHIALSGEVQPGEDWNAELTKAVKQAITEETDWEARCLYMLMAHFRLGPDWLPNLLSEINARVGDPLESEAFQDFMVSLPSVPSHILKEARNAVLGNQSIVSAPLVDEWILGYDKREANKGIRFEALCWSLIRQKDSPAEVLTECAPWHGYDYSLACLGHPNTSPMVLNECRQCAESPLARLTKYQGFMLMLNVRWHERIARYLHARYSKQFSEAIQWEYLYNTDFLARLAYLERFRKTWNPKHHRRVRELRNDPNRYVRAAARGL
jgi:hypothetical protein